MRLDEICKFINKIISFSVEERNRYLDINQNYNRIYLEHFYNKNYEKDSFNNIMAKNQEWIDYNISQIRFELSKISELIHNIKSIDVKYIKDSYFLQKEDDFMVKVIKWFNQKLDYIYETRSSSKTCYFNELEENKLFSFEVEKLTLNVRQIIKEMLNCLSRLINIINRGHCYYYELYLMIERIETATPIIDDYKKEYLNYRNRYFEEVNMAFTEFKNDTMIYYS